MDDEKEGIADKNGAVDSNNEKIYSLNKIITSALESIPFIGKYIVNAQMSDCEEGFSKLNTPGCKAIKDVIAKRK